MFDYKQHIYRYLQCFSRLQTTSGSKDIVKEDIIQLAHFVA